MYIDMLEKIERRATKLIPRLIDLLYEERLIKEFGLTTPAMQKIKEGGELIFFKRLNGCENIDSTTFLN